MMEYMVMMSIIIVVAAIGSTMDLIWVIKNKSSK